MDFKAIKVKIKQGILSKIGIYNKIYVYWWTPLNPDGYENFGDILNKYIISKLTNKKIVHVFDPNKEKFKKYYKHYFAIGSVIRFVNKNSVVWGSGIIKSDDEIDRASFLAVRGPRTGKRLEELNLENPQVYGDPAILIANFYTSNIAKKYKYGIIPHYVDYEEVIEKFRDNKDVLVVNLMTKNVEETISQINSCEFMVSSSLHGIIVSHAYNIPCAWIKLSTKLYGDDVKFYDYFESVDVKNTKVYNYVQANFDYEILKELAKKEKENFPDYNIFELRKKKLIEVCPF